MKKQRMSIEQYVEVTDWIKANKHRIETTEQTQSDACLYAEAELGYSVPITTIQRCAKIAKVKWAKSPPPPVPVPLEHEAIVILIGAIAGLYVETGRTIPAELANLQSTYVRDIPDKDAEVKCVAEVKRVSNKNKSTINLHRENEEGL